MKKSIKSEKPAAPQAKSVKKTVEPAPAKKAVAPKKITRPKVAPIQAAIPPTEVTAAVPIATAQEVAGTTIIAQFDVGFGNQLFIRGSGPGLSWETGVPMTCVGDTQWSHRIPGANAPILFKFLINDQTWSIGPDFTVAPGATVVLTPSF